MKNSREDVVKFLITNPYSPADIYVADYDGSLAINDHEMYDTYFDLFTSWNDSVRIYEYLQENTDRWNDTVRIDEYLQRNACSTGAGLVRFAKAVNIVKTSAGQKRIPPLPIESYFQMWGQLSHV